MYCRCLYSDEGLNFKGWETKFKKLMKHCKINGLLLGRAKVIKVILFLVVQKVMKPILVIKTILLRGVFRKL